MLSMCPMPYETMPPTNPAMTFPMNHAPMRSGCSDLSGGAGVSNFLARAYTQLFHTVPHRYDDCESRSDCTFQESEEESSR
jgi:hypothetical protein